ncbi:hypothetical protein [Nocardia heshunensis]
MAAITTVIILLAVLAVCVLILRSVRSGSVRIEVEPRDAAPREPDPER